MTASNPAFGHAATVSRWLAVIGIGEDGAAGLSPAARTLIDQAELVVGGARHLALVDGLGKAERLAWPSPLTDALPLIAARRGRPVVVLASGDPFLYGVGVTLTSIIDPAEMIALPAPSAFSLAANRLGWAGQDVVPLSLHGRSFERLYPALQPHARLLILSWDGTTPTRVAAALTERGFGGSRLTVLERLGGPREAIRATTAAHFGAELGAEPIDGLNTIAVEVIAGPDARVLPRASGLADDWFVSEGQITKREIRAVTLSALAPRRGELLWDIGAGSGSVSIEWMLADPANRAIAIEPRADRRGRIAQNAASLGVPDLNIRAGRAPEILTDLPRPDAIFVGGGGSDPALIDAAIAALPTGGRLVVNGVTIETQAELMRRYGTLGGELVQLAVARADTIGGFHGFRAAMPVVQWVWTKPHAPEATR